MTPHPLTVDSIELLGHTEGNNGWWSVPCGCRYKRRAEGVVNRVIGWRLCPYHQGYNDGVEVALLDGDQ